MVIGLEQGADLHMSQLMPLPLTVSCFSKIQMGFTFLVLAQAHPGSPGQRAVKWVCVCVCISDRDWISFYPSNQGGSQAHISIITMFCTGVIRHLYDQHMERQTLTLLIKIIFVHRQLQIQIVHKSWLYFDVFVFSWLAIFTRVLCSKYMLMSQQHYDTIVAMTVLQTYIRRLFVNSIRRFQFLVEQFS